MLILQTFNESLAGNCASLRLEIRNTGMSWLFSKAVHLLCTIIYISTSVEVFFFVAIFFFFVQDVPVLTIRPKRRWTYAKKLIENIRLNLFVRDFVFAKIDFEYSPSVYDLLMSCALVTNFHRSVTMIRYNNREYVDMLLASKEICHKNKRLNFSSKFHSESTVVRVTRWAPFSTIFASLE